MLNATSFSWNLENFSQSEGIGKIRVDRMDIYTMDKDAIKQGK